MFDEFLNIADQAAAENDLPHYSTAAPKCTGHVMSLAKYLIILNHIKLPNHHLQIWLNMYISNKQMYISVTYLLYIS